MFARIAWFSAGLLLASAAAPGLVMAAPPQDPRGFDVTERVFDSDGRLIWELGRMRHNSDLGFATHYTHQRPSGSDDAALTDCASTANKLAPWRWTSPYAATASSYDGILDASARTWDTATGTTILESISFGASAIAGKQDFVNQHDWVFLGAGGTIAVTTTWYSLSSGVAVESDARYNTYYAWSTDGSAGAMDVQNIATHELGHTFGLDHPKGSPAKISCLTMYAYGDFGETRKRTLGDGDLLGLRKKYGA